MLNLLESIVFILLYIAYLFTAVLISVIIAEKWVWSDRTFVRLLYFLIVGLFLASLVL